MIVRMFRVMVYTAVFFKLLKKKTATNAKVKQVQYVCFTYILKDNACQQGGIMTLSQ